MNLFDRIRAVLIERWDPLGLAETPGEKDDYDAYAREIRAILADPEATEARIAHYLEWVETSSLHIQARPEAARQAAAGVMAIKREFDAARGRDRGGA